MKMFRSLFVTLLLITMARPASAELLVLVHGYLGSARSWESSGVNQALEQDGWRRAGVVTMGPEGPRLLPARAGLQGRKAYTVELPSIAPLMMQADHLQAMLGLIAAHNPGEPIILVGHSAGGVVARIVAVRNGGQGIKGLVSIAAPQLGTARAVEALEATSSSGPLGWIKDLFGGGLYHTVKHSRGALLDLTPAHPGNLLFWLNGQPHPDIPFHSVVRTGPVGTGDELVPLYSQDLNNVPALRGRSGVTVVAAGHALAPEDGRAIARIVAGLSG